MVKDEIVKEWFLRGERDIADAEFLLENDRSLENVAFHVHQATEKYLKGFLIYNEWELEKIHDLVKLLKEAIKYDESFTQFTGFVRIVTRFYFESRYPIGYDLDYTKEEMKYVVEQANNLINLIKEKVQIQ